MNKRVMSMVLSALLLMGVLAPQTALAADARVELSGPSASASVGGQFSVKVKNTAGVPLDYKVEFTMGGETQTKTLSLPAGAAPVISFPLTRSGNAQTVKVTEEGSGNTKYATYRLNVTGYRVFVSAYYGEDGKRVSNISNNHSYTPLYVGEYLNMQDLAPVGATVTKIVIGGKTYKAGTRINLGSTHGAPTIFGTNVTVKELHFVNEAGESDVVSAHVGDRIVLTNSMMGVDLSASRYVVYSDDPETVRVDSNTRAVALKVGKTTLNVLDTTTKKVVARKAVNVGSQTSIVESTLHIGPDSQTIRANVNYYCASITLDGEAISRNSLNWKSSNTKVLTVDRTGRFRGLKEGTALLTATTRDGGTSASIKITVVED